MQNTLRTPSVTRNCACGTLARMSLPNGVRHVLYVAELQPTWTWVGVALAVVGALGAVFTDSPQSATKTKQLTEQVIKLTGSLARQAGPLLLVLAIGCIAGIGTSACSGGPTIPPTVVNTGIDVSTCVLDVVSKDLLAGKSLPEALQDAAVRCIGLATDKNVSTVADIWAAHKAAENREIEGGVK
jgi:hypothetical protein